MKIGFDISQTGAHNKAGCGYYAHSLIDALLSLNSTHEFFLFPSFGDFYFDSSMPLNNPYSQKSSYGPLHSNFNDAKSFWLNELLENDLSFLDIIHANNFWCPTQFNKARVIYTFYDFGFLVNPDEWTTEVNRQGCFNGAFRAAMAADWVVAISKFSKRHFLETFPHFPEERVRVVYPNSRFDKFDIEAIKPNLKFNLIENKFWLSVGTIEPRKNLIMLVNAYKDYASQVSSPMPLVIAGGSGWMTEEFQKILRSEGLDVPIILTGYVNDAELIWLYQNCYANLYPSLFEGFGLPILEAMQFGAATICSNTSSMPEVAGNAAILLNPLLSSEWTSAMINLASNPIKRRELSKLGPKQAEKFTGTKNAEQIISLYEEALLLPKLFL